MLRMYNIRSICILLYERSNTYVRTPLSVGIHTFLPQPDRVCDVVVAMGQICSNCIAGGGETTPDDGDEDEEDVVGTPMIMEMSDRETVGDDTTGTTKGDDRNGGEARVSIRDRIRCLERKIKRGGKQTEVTVTDGTHHWTPSKLK